MRKNELRGFTGLCVVFVSMLLLLATASCATPRPAPPVVTATQVQVSETYGKLPLSFEANQGQTDEGVKFLSRGPRHTLFLTASEAVLVLPRREPTANSRLPGARLRPAARGPVTQTVLRMTFVNANPEPRLAGTDELPGRANYFIGNDPTKWRTNIPTYARVRYTSVYPGIDLVWYGNQRQLEYDFVVGPGADPNWIRLGFKGAEKLEVDAQGDLVLHTAAGLIRQRKPVIYQEVNGKRRDIAGGYVLKGARRVGFRVAAYDADRPLVIDPALFYSTYLGGSDDDSADAIAVDSAGNAYIGGETASANFPTTVGAFQPTFGGGGGFGFGDVFVTKLNPTGSGLVYSTYLGGSGDESGRGIAVDAAGNAYVGGFTTSSNFPTTPGAFQPTLGGGFDAFVTKLNPTGSGLVYSTYLGGSGADSGGPIAVDAAGSAYVTGSTVSLNFPTTLGAVQPTFGGAGPLGTGDAFVTKLSPAGSVLLYSTYLGGNSDESGNGIAVDTAGNAYVAGNTVSANFPTTLGAFQGVFGGGPTPFDAFVTKVDPTGATLLYSTYLGGSGDDLGFGIALDTSGNAYVTACTTSSDFPTTPGAFQPTFGGAGPSAFGDAFVTKVNPTGSGLVYSTYLGGSNDDCGSAVAVDSSGHAYVAGYTTSINFPTAGGAFQSTLGGGFDVFVTKLNPAGSALVYSSYLGGNGDEFGFGIAVDPLSNPNAYVAGQTTSMSFPTTPGAFQPTFGGAGPNFFDDGFVAKIAQVVIPPGPFSGRVTGGGTTDVAEGIGTFSFIIQRASTGELFGQLQYFNHASGARLNSETYTSLVIVGNTATFNGTCTVDGAACTFIVNVTDNGEPGTTDTFTISVSGGPTEGGTLRSGNILIQQ